MSWLVSAVGGVIVLATLRDIFHTLWHPSGFGTLSRALFKLVWRTSKRLGRSGDGTQMSGPLGILVTVLAWTALLVAGWTLVYLPHMPEGFYFGSSLNPGASSDLVASLYLSMVAVTTLGFGDILPADPVLRILTPLQALIGFVLLTAGISWILQVYPALIRRRALAKRLSLMAATDTTHVVTSAESSVATQLLDSVSEALTLVEMDLLQYGETYYFREGDGRMSLAAGLPYVVELAAAGSRSSTEEVRHSAAMLREALESLAERLDRSFLGTGGALREVLDAFSVDHQHGARPAARS